MITAKDKVKELVDKFKSLEHPTYDGWGTMIDFNSEVAKQCALICVDEILKQKYSDHIYWQSVRTEIANL